MSARLPSPGEEGTMHVIHQDEYVSEITQYAYNVFAAISKWLGI